MGNGGPSGGKPSGKMGSMPQMRKQSSNKTYKTMDAYLKDLNKKAHGSRMIRKQNAHILQVLKTLRNIINNLLNQFQPLMI